MASWFVTRKGCYFTYSVVGVIASSTLGIPFLMNGPFLKQYQSVIQLYERDKPKPVSPELLAQAQSVLQNCNLSEKQKQRVSFFLVPTTDVFHAGAYNSPWGAIIGLPPIFNSDSKIKLQDVVLIGRDNIDWDIEGFDYLEAVELSESAKKFAIAREIYAANINNIAESAAAAFLSFIVPARMCYWINRKKNMFKFPFKNRAIIYGSFYAWGMLLYISLKQPFAHLHSADCDKKAAMLGPEYKKGGLQFYEKMLQRNKALRSLMGKSGESRFTEEGNERGVFFIPKLKITTRLDDLKKVEPDTV